MDELRFFDTHFAITESLLHNAYFQGKKAPEKFLLLGKLKPIEQTASQRRFALEGYQMWYESTQRKVTLT